MDTQCQNGNWISQALVKRLNKLHSITTISNPPTLDDMNGRPVLAQGTVKIEFKRSRGNKFYDCELYVCPPQTSHFDVIFGADFINEHEIMTMNPHACMPVLERDKISPSKCRNTAFSFTVDDLTNECRRTSSYRCSARVSSATARGIARKTH